METHAEVVALQEKFGISYKDACHRLYFQQMEIARSAEKNAKVWGDLEKSLKASQDYLHGYDELLAKAHEEAAHADATQDDPDEDPADGPPMPTLDKGKGRATGP